MGLESHNGRLQASCRCDLFQPGEHGLMPQMYTIKIADRKRQRSPVGLMEMSINLHPSDPCSAHKILEMDSHHSQADEINTPTQQYQQKEVQHLVLYGILQPRRVLTGDDSQCYR